MRQSLCHPERSLEELLLKHIEEATIIALCNMDALKRPRAHTMSPHWRGYHVGPGNGLFTEQPLYHSLPPDIHMLRYIGEDGTQCAHA